MGSQSCLNRAGTWQVGMILVRSTVMMTRGLGKYSVQVVLAYCGTQSSQ